MANLSMKHLTKVLDSFSPYQAPENGNEGKQYKFSAVCLILSMHEGQKAPRLLMMRRAKRRGDPWSGHMAFPGGRIEPQDESVQAGALRELHEEMGVDAHDLNYLGRLSDLHTLNIPGQRQLVVSPFVFEAKKSLVLKPNYEADGTYWIPLEFFAQARRKNMYWWRRKRLIKLPFYRYKKRRIWGLSLAMIDELFLVLENPLAKKLKLDAYRDTAKTSKK